MMAISEKVQTDFVAWTNADILLAGDVVNTIDLLQSKHDAAISSSSLWMAVAARWDLSPSTSLHSISLIENKINTNTLDSYLRQEGVLHSQGKHLYCAIIANTLSITEC